MDNFQNLVPVEYQSQRVLTSAQLAKFYGTSTDNIKRNFNNNRSRFVEGKHFFKLEGKDLAMFKDRVNDIHFVEGDRVTNVHLVQKGARVLYLWTKRGAARHAKMLNTEKAWEVFEALEDSYFEQQAKSVQTDDMREILLQILEAVNSSSNAEKILNELAKAFKQYAQTGQKNGDFERGKTLAKMIFALKASPKKERIADIATNLIVGEKVF
ncbi:MAG: ORF6N domain-containing protein [Selenomonadaceae bacterium]|nr:ORF6N domain-containing protein [Selenomonadaceae bacterium]